MPESMQVVGAPSADARPAQAPVEILLVDDHPAKLMALESALAPLGETLVSVTSGRDALRKLLTHDFATVVLDVNMPGMDGFETAQLLRGRPRSARMPIIFVSSVNLSEADALRGYSLGAVDYIPAPIVPEVLRAKISVFVDLHRKTQEARLRAEELEARTRELQESQQQLQVAERMAALGTLSAGLGHDMGNALLPIQAQLESLADAELTPTVRETLTSVQSCVAYLRRLAQGLRALAQAPDAAESTDQRTEITPWWADMEPMLRSVLPKGLVLRASIQPELPAARLARHLLSQLVFNLVQNAGDALRARGSGTVTVAVDAEPGADRVVVTISDDGPGMSPEVQARCFEPFFSTKPRALSTGLGLALVHGIIRRSGGEVSVHSEHGRGTSFRCSLPAAAASAAPTGEGRTAFVEIADGRQRSLVTMMLKAGGASLVQSTDRASADVWVCDADAACVADTLSTGGESPAQRVLLLGQATTEPHPAVQVVDQSAGAKELRLAIRDLLAADSLRGAAATEPGGELVSGSPE
jgi:signal transduction histidine kinase